MTLSPSDTEGRLAGYFVRIGAILGHKKRRESFATYAMGLLGDGARKSVEPIACRACGDPSRADALHQKLLHFVANSEWSDREVRRTAARYVIEEMTRRSPVRTWIIDDTGFLKQGEDSVGVQRQYTGSAGKITNCQIGVSLSVASDEAQVPIDFELFLPKSWTEEPERRKAARIPDSVVFKSKIDLAIDMITRAVEDQVPGDIVLADSFYGDAIKLRDVIRCFGLDYALGVDAATKLHVVDGRGRRSESESAKDIALRLGRDAFRKVTWRQGTKDALSSQFVFRRVQVANKGAVERDALWLIIEWPESQDEPTRYSLTTLGERMSKKQIVRLLKERYRTEVVYEEMKGNLGLDHFEGRSFVGWHHHVTVALCCYAFIASERLRHFPPSTRSTIDGAHAISSAA